MNRTVSIAMLISVVMAGALFAEQKKSNAVILAKAMQDTSAKKVFASAVHYGKISVTTVPDSAEIALDSIEKPKSPCVLDSLMPGTHFIIAKRKGYYGKKITIEVMPDSSQHLDIVLVKPASIFVSTTPAAARVLFDGRDAGVTPYENSKVKPGSHSIRLEKDQYGAIETSYNAVDGKTDSLAFALQPLPSILAQPPLQPKTKEIPVEQKQGLDKTLLIILTGIFVVFGVAVFAIESGSN